MPISSAGRPNSGSAQATRRRRTSPPRSIRTPIGPTSFTARAALYQQIAAAAIDREQARKWLDGTLKDFEIALKAQPRDAASLVRRAEIYLDTGDYLPAIDDCDKALEIDPRLPAARVARARGLIEKGDFDKAIADCTAAIETDSDGWTPTRSALRHAWSGPVKRIPWPPSPNATRP